MSGGPSPSRLSFARRIELGSLWTVSLSRFVFAAAFITTSDPKTRLWLIVGAGLSDVIDGAWARWRHLTTRWGALIDPLADRAFVLSGLATYLWEGALSGWAFAILVTRDVLTTFAFGLSRLLPPFRHVAFQARTAGKLVTFTQFLTLVLVIAAPRWVLAAVVLNGIATVWAVGDYTATVWKRRTRPPLPPVPLHRRQTSPSH